MERDADKKDWLMIEQQIRCPMCGSKARLEEYENDMYIDRIKKRIKFKMVSYVCNACTNSFTTTESDTIVVDRINKGIRSEQRKSKIKKYVQKPL
jgi:DNA-directed RNA polymerase subunit RPC12/RpoP